MTERGYGSEKSASIILKLSALQQLAEEKGIREATG